MSPAADPAQPPAPTGAGRKVAIVTGASRGIGAGVVAAFRRAGYSVVATSLSMNSDDCHILTVQGERHAIARAQPPLSGAAVGPLNPGMRPGGHADGLWK
jgi:NAD(P)-dependent dehydrogenase (short-subunit alcohol dehydrogenase family)